MRAVELKREGWSQRKIAEVLDVAEPAVSHWLTVAEQDGVNALRVTQPSAVSPA